ncbi:MAG: hypothetical protein U5M50_00475 [Sphingobium sp.]|nr:hypothetical protein [Sphingobium sp.]
MASVVDVYGWVPGDVVLSMLSPSAAKRYLRHLDAGFVVGGMMLLAISVYVALKLAAEYDAAPKEEAGQISCPHSMPIAGEGSRITAL